MMRILPTNVASAFFRADASTSTSTSPTDSTASSSSTSPDSSPPSTLSPTADLVSSRPGHARRQSVLPSFSEEVDTGGVNLGDSIAEGSAAAQRGEGEDMCDAINGQEDLYLILGVSRRARHEDIRRAFLSRSRICHPDKLPQYSAATPAFQRLSYAYETLSKPSSRRLYDLGGARGYDPGIPRQPGHQEPDETLHGVLRTVFAEFMAGDFETIRAFMTTASDGSPGLNFGDDTVDSLESAFRRVRDVLLTGQKYIRIVKFELLRLYEIQYTLRQLSYFDLFGRLRLTLALTRVTLEIPMVLDRHMREDVVVVNPGAPPPPPRPPSSHSPSSSSNRAGDSSDGDERRSFNGSAGHRASSSSSSTTAGQLQRRGLLGPKAKGCLVMVCKVLEKGERFGM